MAIKADTPPRADSIAHFLAGCGWGGAERSLLAGDASFRRYERLRDARKGAAVLMDAPPEWERTEPFVEVGRFLHAQGYSAPEIYAQDMDSGLLLLEDLGDALYTQVLRARPELEEELYLAAADLLAELHARRGARPGIAEYDHAEMMREAMIFAEWWLPCRYEGAELARLQGEYEAMWRELLLQLPALPPVPVLRDFHADNLIWLPEREGLKRIGLLDFQDARIGSPAYDLVSFLEDARRDVRPETARTVLARYIDASGVDEGVFMQAYALLGAQRNLKIVGIFSRLALRDGKPAYLNYLPRVWGHLDTDLAAPALHALRDWMAQVVPPGARGPDPVAARLAKAEA